MDNKISMRHKDKQGINKCARAANKRSQKCSLSVNRCNPPTKTTIRASTAMSTRPTRRYYLSKTKLKKEKAPALTSSTAKWRALVTTQTKSSCLPESRILTVLSRS